MKYEWFYEPDQTSIKLEKEFQKKLVSIYENHNISKLSKETNLSKQTLHNYFNEKYMSVGGLKLLLKNAKIDLKSINQHIKKVGSCNCKFPINLKNESASILISAILGDGSFTSRIMYKNKDKELINKIKKSTKELFGDVIIYERISDRGIPYIMLPRITERILNYVGLKKGKQMFYNPHVPQLIKTANKKIKKVFIQQFFDDEGWPEPAKRKIGLSQSSLVKNEKLKNINEKIIYPSKLTKKFIEDIQPPNILIDIQNILKSDFNINTYLRFKRITKRKNHCSACFELGISKKEDIKKFISRINFSSKNKREKVKKMMNQYMKIPENITLLIINESITLHKEKGYFLAKDLVNKFKINHNAIRKRLITLVKRGVFDKKDEKYYLNIKF